MELLKLIEIKLNGIVTSIEMLEKQKPVDHSKIVGLLKRHQSLLKQRNKIISIDKILSDMVMHG